MAKTPEKTYGAAKLTAKTILAIRASKPEDNEKVAAKYGIGKILCSRIRGGSVFKEVTA